MFQSIEYKRSLGYNAATKLYEIEFELTDSDFSCVAAEGAIWEARLVAASADVVIREYSKRKLNVAANLVRCLQFQEKKYGYSITDQIVWAERYQHQFTPELKADLDKYLILV
jgi:hypothetical protein